jgi:hypothetical protein
VHFAVLMFFNLPWQKTLMSNIFWFRFLITSGARQMALCAVVFYCTTADEDLDACVVK